MHLISRFLRVDIAILSVSALGIHLRIEKKIKNYEAQSTDGSFIDLVFREFDVKAEVRLPLAELEIAFGKELQDGPNEKIQRYKVELNKYILSHLSAKGPDGLSWHSSFIDEFSIKHIPGRPS